MESTPPTNELIERLTARLSPEAREIQIEIDAWTDTLDPDTLEVDVEARINEATALMDTLPEDDRLLLQQIAQLKARAHESRGEKYMDEAKMLRDAAGLIEQAQAIQYAAGEAPDESMTFREALAILEAHGENVPGMDTERVVEVPIQEETRAVPAFYPDFGNPDNWTRWDGSAQAEAWAALMYFRDRCIDASVGELASMDFGPIDYTRLIAVLWNIDEEEAAEIVRRRQQGG